MSPRRLMLAHAAIGTLLFGSLTAVVFDKEYWPFSPYPMYSHILNDKVVSGMRLYGVTQEEPHREVLLRDSDYLRPFQPIVIEAALRRIHQRENREERRRTLNRALLDSLRRYDELRVAGRHDGPRLQGIRLYQERWQLDARVENLNRPGNRRLIDEVERRPRE